MGEQRTLTEDEHTKLVKIGDSFYDELGLLVADHVARTPRQLESETLCYLQDKCSVYGVDYDKHLASRRLVHGTEE
jgi:hypothetical protein